MLTALNGEAFKAQLKTFEYLNMQSNADNYQTLPSASPIVASNNRSAMKISLKIDMNLKGCDFWATLYMHNFHAFDEIYFRGPM